jgi:hypothetical protein
MHDSETLWLAGPAPHKGRKGLSILHEIHDTREFDFARYALRCRHEGSVEVGVGWETKR